MIDEQEERQDTGPTTYFHVPEARKKYVPGKAVGRDKGGYGGSMEGYVYLQNGTTVTLHGVSGEFKVVRSHFHCGQPDEEEGMHIILERV